jgi:hypothetical protein
LSKFLSLLLCSCALLKAPPPAAEDATCIGIAGFATGLDLASQYGDNTIPRFDLDLSECVQIPGPGASCEDIAKFEAWVAWVEGAHLVDGKAHLLMPAVEIDECPQ